MHLSAFIHQKSYEHIVHEVRRHPITLVPAIAGLVILLALPVALVLVLRVIWPELIAGPAGFPISVLLGSVYYLSVALFFYTFFIAFYLDLLVVTNDRLLFIQQHGLFSRSVSELDLYQIQDLSSEVQGFFANTFNYGNLSIQTAAATVKFFIENVPNPDRLRREILDLAEADRKYHTTGAIHPTTATPTT